VEDTYGQWISQETKDIASGLTTEFMEVTERDEFGRPLRIDYDDGSYEEKTYSCCGLYTNRDRNGMVTTFTYDDLKRVETETWAGLTTIYSYDGSGRTLTLTRRGSDNSEIVVETNTYDLAGRQTSSTNAINDLTDFTETVDGSGRTVRTTTLPSGATRVETSHKDGQVYTVGGTGAHPLKYEYGTHSNGRYGKEIRIGTAGAETEWTKTSSDLAGRTTTVEESGRGTSTSYYNALGQLSKQVDADGVATLYAYNGEGEREKTALDIDRNDTIGTTDRITISERSVLTAHSATVERSETRIINASNGEVVASRVDRTPNGKQVWSEQWGLPSTMVVTTGSGGQRTETVRYPDLSQKVRTYTNDRLITVVRSGSGGGVVMSSVSNTYDPHGRLQYATDLRNGTTTYTYYNDDRPHTITTPSPGFGGSAQITEYIYDYDGLNARTTQVLPDASEVVSEYWPTGELKKTSGSQTYTVDYAYDPQGRMKTLTTTGAAGPSVTTWVYSGTTGRLAEKLYDDNKGPSYSYTAGGRLETRTWERGITTTYGYDNAGDLETIDYSDGTPDVTYGRNRLGQIASITDGAGNRTLTTSEDGRPLTESYTSGTFIGVSTTYGYDSLKRRSAHTLVIGSGTIGVGYTYDGVSRLQTVTSGSDVATYSYLPNSSLTGGITQTHGSTTVLTGTRTYDNLNRLRTISTVSGTSVVSSFTYGYNDLNQRMSAELQDGTKWAYGYDGKGQVTTAARSWADESPVAGQQYGYQFDGIGNRTSTTVNGRSATYTPNELNQYEEREVPGAIDIIGSATAAATVSVNGGTAARKGDYFYKTLSIDNGTQAQYPEVEVMAVLNNSGTNGEDLIGEQSGHVYLPKTPEMYTYDDDGNLTGDGQWTYSWDGENRLVVMESLSGAPSESKKKLEFSYDGQSRRIGKKVFTWSGSAYALSVETKFIYDGWNLMAETNSSNTVQRSYLWGNDLSGTPQGAGGAGGLLAIEEGAERFLPAYDGNGNVMEVVKSSDQSSAGSYIYGAFGEAIRTDEGEVTNLFRFSTQYHDIESGLAYYGYRYYNPEMGRWSSRDPIEEVGGLNLYGFVGNDALSFVDVLGEKEYDSPYDAAHAAGVDAIIEERKKALDSGKRRENGLGFEPVYQPREHGGKICCKGSKFLTTSIGAGEQRSVQPRLAPDCPEGSDLVGYWHTHPGEYNSFDKSFSKAVGFSGTRFWPHKDGDSDFVDNPNNNGLPLSMTREIAPGEFETKFLYPEGVIK
jgi:RHS repeat-associated protein